MQDAGDVLPRGDVFLRGYVTKQRNELFRYKIAVTWVLSIASIVAIHFLFDPPSVTP